MPSIVAAAQTTVSATVRASSRPTSWPPSPNPMRLE